MPLQIELLPDAPVMEYLDGEARRKVSPRSKHSRVQALLAMLLERCGGDLGMVGTEWDYRIGLVDASNSFLVPDVAFITHERLDAIEKGSESSRRSCRTLRWRSGRRRTTGPFSTAK